MEAEVNCVFLLLPWCNSFAIFEVSQGWDGYLYPNSTHGIFHCSITLRTSARSGKSDFSSTNRLFEIKVFAAVFFSLRFCLSFFGKPTSTFEISPSILDTRSLAGTPMKRVSDLLLF
jgi:hypothetical protein